MLAWLLVAVGATVISSSAGSHFNASFTLKGAESTNATVLLQRSAPRASGSSDQIVVASRSGRVTDAGVSQRVTAMLAQVRTVPHVGAVASPYGPDAARQRWTPPGARSCSPA